MEQTLYLTSKNQDTVYSTKLSRNLCEIATNVGLYRYLWKPNAVGIRAAKELIKPITSGLDKLKDQEETYINSEDEKVKNAYKEFIPLLENYLRACKMFPNSFVDVN